ncbi:MAG: hypothetical protein WCD18_26130, partial [Thermosynechococcaceae cyanobacterium]
LKLIRQFRQLFAAGSLKIVVLAPPATAEDPQSYLDAGADTFLRKPLNPEHLVHKVDRLLVNPAMVP